jgi:hypothetical protein
MTGWPHYFEPMADEVAYHGMSVWRNEAIELAAGN